MRSICSLSLFGQQYPPSVDALVFAGVVGERSHELFQVIDKAVERYQPIDWEKNIGVLFGRLSTSVVIEIGARGTEKGRVLVCQIGRGTGTADPYR